MSFSVKGEGSSPLCEGQGGFNRTFTTNISKDSLDGTKDVEAGHSKSKEDGEKASPPSPHPMAFTIDFGAGKQVDKSRLEELAKKSQMRHQRVQSMSASLTKPSPTAQKPPLSAKLPRKAQGYNSEGYFSSDQEDSNFSGSVKHRQSPLAQTFDKTHITSPLNNRHLKSPENFPKKSKSPIVDSIMSRSDILPSRQGLNLPLKSAISSYSRDVHRTPSYNNISSSYQPRSTMADILDRSPDGVMLADISSPEFDLLTPDNGFTLSEPKSPSIRSGRRAVSEMPDLVYSPKMMCKEPLYIDDDVDKESNASSTGTYTIEGDNYTEEQKARMSIDRTFSSTTNTIESKRAPSNEKDPELIFDYPSKVITREPKRDVLHSPLKDKTFTHPKVSKDKNVLEISCCYESPTENDLAAQTSKQIKSTRSYLEKIKNRVRTITEKTFAKSPPKHVVPADLGSFTSVTTSGVLSSKFPPKPEISRRRCSLTKSEIDQTDYVHRLSRESSVPVNLPSKLDGARFESTPLRNAQKCLMDDRAVSSDTNNDEVVGKLSYMSLNRCKGDKTWIQDWAESVKKYNNNTLQSQEPSNGTFVVDDDRPPLSPRREMQKGSISRNPYSSGTPTKIPSPVGTLHYRRTPDLIPSNQDTESYLQKTQNVISSLQAKLNTTRINNYTHSPDMTTSVLSDKTLSRLPISQLSRSNSLNYRLRRKINPEDNSPLRSPNNYTITGSNKLPESTRVLLNSASRSLDTDRKERDSNMNSPISNSSDDKTLSNRPYNKHTRHKSFDGRNAKDLFTENLKNANPAVSLKTVLKNNAEILYPRIDQTRCLNDRLGSTIKRSSSFSTVVKNNNYIDKIYQNQNLDYLSDDSDTLDKSQEISHKKPLLNRGRIDSPDLKIVPTNSPKCSNTPELQRKYGTGLVRASVRVTNKERALNTRCSESPIAREERSKSHQSRRISEPTKQAVLNRLTKSRSSTREFQPKNQEKAPGLKKPAQHRSSSALASKEMELSNWKKRSTYDPMRAAAEGRKRQQAARQARSPPSNSSPVHRSQSFHTTNMADLTLDYSSEETEDDAILNLPIDNVMVSSTHSDNIDVRRKDYRDLRRQAMNNDVVFSRDYVAGFQVNQPESKCDRSRREMAEKRRTFILNGTADSDKRKTFILDSDTNSTANGSSPRTSSVFSHKSAATSDTEGDSGPESAPVVLRQGNKKGAPKQRHSGDYSMSSSTTSISQKKPIQPRYLDISKYKTENNPKNFLRRDPSRTYVVRSEKGVNRGSAQHLEMEQKKQELEKWKRRASYDPRKSAALDKTKPCKTASNVLRSQSFHGPVLASPALRPAGPYIAEDYLVDSDNDF